jgi:hypothetical protein
MLVVVVLLLLMVPVILAIHGFLVMVGAMVPFPVLVKYKNLKYHEIM